ncbi:MAG: hypothetical protein OXI76_15965 [Gemmatimonadota bacterium]|nr:hypothetical protein [Gemmatimonadota bacterium]
MSSLQSPRDTDSAEFPAGIAEVSDELLSMFGGSESALGRVAGLNADDAFNHLALKVHAAQRASSPVLRRYWDAVSHGQPAAWDEIPTVPVRAFRDVPIVSGTPEVVFRTSGTTGGGVRGGGSNARRGEHHVASLELYRAAARDNYRRHLFAGAPALSIISLVPNPADVPDSSLATMAGFIAREKEVAQTAWAFGPGSGVDIGTVRKAVAAAARSPTPPPILLLTTALALVQLLHALTDSPLPLPDGSRIMETGGFKGRTAEVDRTTLYGRVHRTLGVPGSHIVNEYGMTEMLSQAYDCVAGQGPPAGERVHRFPPWVRTRALDPADLAPLPPGRAGLLAHFDLANAASVCHLLTEDYGSVTGDGGVRLLGRAPGAAARGCSLAAEEFLRATGAR